MNQNTSLGTAADAEVQGGTVSQIGPKAFVSSTCCQCQQVTRQAQKVQLTSYNPLPAHDKGAVTVHGVLWVGQAHFLLTHLLELNNSFHNIISELQES